MKGFLPDDSSRHTEAQLSINWKKRCELLKAVIVCTVGITINFCGRKQTVMPTAIKKSGKACFESSILREEKLKRAVR